MNTRMVLFRFGSKFKYAAFLFFVPQVSFSQSYSAGDGSTAGPGGNTNINWVFTNPKFVRGSNIYAVAIGNSASSNGEGGTSLGDNAEASARITTALGAYSLASADGATSLGVSALSTGLSAVSVGRNTTASGNRSLALGTDASALGDWSSAVGPRASAISKFSTTIGSFARAGAANSSDGGQVAIGYQAAATGIDTLTVGRGANSAGNLSTAIGAYSSASYVNSVAIGSNATADGRTINDAAYNPGLAAISGLTPAGEVSVGSVGSERRLTNLAAGANDTDAVNISQLKSLASTVGDVSSRSVNYGTNSDGSVNYNEVILNPGGIPARISNVAQGELSGNSSDVVNGSQLFATNTTVANINSSVNNIVNNGAGIKYFHANSILADSIATGVNSVSIGPQSVAVGAESLAAGVGATATTNGSIAVGNQSSAQVLGGVALGQGSVSDREVIQAVGLIPVGNGAIRYDTSDAALVGAVSVGKNGEYRQITNVADATDDHDVVTLRQLAGAMGSLSSTGTMYFHANSVNPQDSLAAGEEAIAVGPATVVNGDNGIGIGNQAIISQSAPSGIAIGRSAQVQLASAIAIGTESQAQGEQALALGAGAMASQSMSIALGSSSIAVVGAQSDYTAYGLSTPQTSVGELGIGTSLGNRKITGVAAGSAPNDAVNVEQLTAIGDQVTQNTSSITMLGGRVTNIEGSISNINNGVGVKYFHANSTQIDSEASGADSVAIGGSAQASGYASFASGNEAQASGAGSVAMGNNATASADGSVVVGQGSSDNGRGAESYTGKYSNVSNTSVGTFSVGNSAIGATRTVSNIADGREDTDAVNVRQLDGAVAESKKYTDDSLQNVNNSISNIGSAITNVDNRVTRIEGDVTKIQNGTDGMFQVNKTSTAAKPSATGSNAVAGGAGAVASGNNSAAIGNNAKATGEGSLAIGNGASARGENSTALGSNSVADRDNSVSVGSAGSERQIINVAEATQGTDAVNFDQLNRSVSNITSNANAYTDQRYSELKHDLKKQDDTLSAGIAGAMAMASLPQPYLPGASMTSIGAANYRGQSALSLGVSRISDNGRWVSKLQASTNTQGDTGVGVGVGYQW
ncbi:TPA: cell surface protein [Pseudomonas aeruginosa]|nr:cell surface protein [Pseudomonas aeruginosa]